MHGKNEIRPPQVPTAMPRRCCTNIPSIVSHSVCEGGPSTPSHRHPLRSPRCGCWRLRRRSPSTRTTPTSGVFEGTLHPLSGTLLGELIQDGHVHVVGERFGRPSRSSLRPVKPAMTLTRPSPHVLRLMTIWRPRGPRRRRSLNPIRIPTPPSQITFRSGFRGSMRP